MLLNENDVPVCMYRNCMCGNVLCVCDAIIQYIYMIFLSGYESVVFLGWRMTSLAL